MAMEIIEVGPLATVQDIGRTGYARLGYAENGACDKYSMKLANLLAGNSGAIDRAAVMEFTMKGGKIRFTSPQVLALAGADMKPELNGRPTSMYRPVLVKAGDVLSLGMAVCGLRCYMAVYGGIQVPLVMGSRSTNLRCGLGGFLGRALKPGDSLESCASEQEIQALRQRLSGREELWYVNREEQWLRQPSGRCRLRQGERITVLRTVAGPQEDAFTQAGIHAFEYSLYRLTPQCDRMACKLEGPPIETVNGSDMISDGIVEGSVQIASNGMPMVMMADHQTTGGYAKIGTVISTDIPALAQLRPGESVIFRFISLQESIEAYRRENRKLQWLKARLERVLGNE